jgi:hypothetical protein
MTHADFGTQAMHLGSQTLPHREVAPAAAGDDTLDPPIVRVESRCHTI